jgi:hypothetical protein
VYVVAYSGRGPEELPVSVETELVEQANPAVGTTGTATDCGAG